MKSIKNFLEKNQKGIVIISFILLFCIGLVNFAFIFIINATSNDECLWIPNKASKDSVIILFDKVKVDGVAWKAGIRDGDQLIAIKNINIHDIFKAQRILNEFKKGQLADYTIKKGDKLLNTKVEIKKLIKMDQFAFMLMAQIWLVIGFVVLMARPNGYIQRLFFKISAAFIVLFTSVYFLGLGTDVSRIYFYMLDYIWTIGGFYASFLILIFFWSFPKPLRFAEKIWVRKTLQIAPIVLIIASYIVRHIFVYPYAGFNNVALGIIIVINCLIFTAFVTGLVSLYINYFRIKDKSQRKPIYIILFAYTLGIASLLYTSFIAPAISDTIFNSPEYYTPIILIAVLPVAFGYSIFKYQLMDVSIVIIIFAMVFQSTKDKFQNFLTAKFYPEQFAYQKVLVKFSTDISSVVGLENILDKTYETFTNALKINNFGIMVRGNNNGDLVLVRSKGIKNKDLVVNQSSIHTFIEQKKSLSKLPALEREEFERVCKGNSVNLVENDIYTIIPMTVKSKVVGLLLLGLKHSGAQFSYEDLELLNAVANQAAISIENARLWDAEIQSL